MTIRHYQPGDEVGQAAVYNTAAASLPRFKSVTLHEVQRRIRARDFDPELRCYAEDGGQIVGYCTLQPNGRIGYPWCLPGHEAHAEPLFAAALATLRRRGVPRAYTAYRNDWPAVNQFFFDRGFVRAREMVNYVLNLLDMPTPAARPSTAISPLQRADVPHVLQLGAGVLRLTAPATLEAYLFNNPYFQADALFALRSRPDAPPLAVGILVQERTYADARTLDADAPCFRLGAFGTEGMATKRVQGLFSFLARPDRTLPGFGMDLLGHAANLLSTHDDLDCFAAQVPSDAPALAGFYQQHFQRQGSFPVLERELM